MNSIFEHILATLKQIFCFIFINSVMLCGTAQSRTYKIHTVAFYNMENLFDCTDEPNVLDELSPILELKSDCEEVYNLKINRMASVIADIGKDITKNTPAIVGICEVENRKATEDLINTTHLKSKNYGIVHYDSPDARGIDVALLYQKDIFTPIQSKSYALKLLDAKSGHSIYTRDQLLVSGILEKDTIHFIVNHWPSRRGGAEKSNAKRVAAAKLNKHILDALQHQNPYNKIIIMGDLNDNPINTSLKQVLRTSRDQKHTNSTGLYNPFETLFRKGFGTTAYRDSWSLFDQIIVTKSLLGKPYTSYKYYKSGIFNKDYLITPNGKYKGYPFRSWINSGLSNGYSDHFPVYMYLIKAVE